MHGQIVLRTTRLIRGVFVIGGKQQMKSVLIIFIAVFLAGCAAVSNNPINGNIRPQNNGSDLHCANDMHRSWGLYNLEFNADHTTCDVVPVRSGSFSFKRIEVPRG